MAALVACLLAEPPRTVKILDMEEEEEEGDPPALDELPALDKVLPGFDSSLA